MFYPLANTTWDAAEYAALQDVISSDRFTMGPHVRAFEEAFAAKFGKKYAVMTSSGSTANLLGIAATFYHPDFGFQAGDEVIRAGQKLVQNLLPNHSDRYEVKICRYRS